MRRAEYKALTIDWPHWCILNNTLCITRNVYLYFCLSNTRRYRILSTMCNPGYDVKHLMAERGSVDRTRLLLDHWSAHRSSGCVLPQMDTPLNIWCRVYYPDQRLMSRISSISAMFAQHLTRWPVLGTRGADNAASPTLNKRFFPARLHYWFILYLG